MGVLGNLAINVFEEGFIYGIMALGVYITYAVLSFPDLSVDGTFPMGMCFAAMCITAGVNPWLTCLLAFLVGCLAGAVTGFLHVKLKITDLLSGILVMTGLWSINLVLTGGAAVLPYYNMPTIFNSGLGSLLPLRYRVVVVAFLIVFAVKLAIDGFLKSKAGLLLRATGDNNRFVISLAENPGKMKIIGLMIGNGCTALAGCVLSQQTESANVTSGTGMVVMSLASVIIGTNLFGRLSFLQATTAVVCGAVTYKACLSIVMQIGLPTNYLKLLMAVLFTLALVSSRVYRKEDH
ncbi:MAG: ABC transporter permease [Eubacteriaceae bacterium]|nr:ABC transporter permease [Eubacteriaceae bacterium]